MGPLDGEGALTMLTPAHVPNSRFLKYRIDHELGRGGMGVVYLAVEDYVERRVAIKVLSPSLATQPDFAARFQAEAQAVALLEHPSIVPLYTAGVHEGTPYIVMQYLEGQSLRLLLDRHRRRGKRLDWLWALHTGVQIADALAIAHKAGIWHRDVKPENIIMGKGGQAWLVDFGLAKAAGRAAITRENEALGTVRYVSPEQACGEATDARADVYSLGVVLYEMIAGHHPIPAADRDGSLVTEILMAHITATPKPLDEVISECPAALADIVMRCIAKSPEERYESGGELFEPLQQLVRQSVPADHPVARRAAQARVERQRKQVVQTFASIERDEEEGEPEDAQDVAPAPQAIQAMTEPLPIGWIAVGGGLPFARPTPMHETYERHASVPPAPPPTAPLGTRKREAWVEAPEHRAREEEWLSGVATIQATPEVPEVLSERSPEVSRPPVSAAALAPAPAPAVGEKRWRFPTGEILAGLVGLFVATVVGIMMYGPWSGGTEAREEVDAGVAPSPPAEIVPAAPDASAAASAAASASASALEPASVPAARAVPGAASLATVPKPAATVPKPAAKPIAAKKKPLQPIFDDGDL